MHQILIYLDFICTKFQHQLQLALFYNFENTHSFLFHALAPRHHSWSSPSSCHDLISHHENNLRTFQKFVKLHTSNKLFSISLFQCTTTAKNHKNFFGHKPFYSCTISRKVYVSGKSNSGQTTACDLHGSRGRSSIGSDLEEEWGSNSN